MTTSPFGSLGRPVGGDLVDVVILEQVGDELPDYCVHGKATCIACRAWCWLGKASSELLAETTYQPLCHPCAVKYIPADHLPVGNVEDYRRVNGLHD